VDSPLIPSRLALQSLLMDPEMKIIVYPPNVLTQTAIQHSQVVQVAQSLQEDLEYLAGPAKKMLEIWTAHTRYRLTCQMPQLNSTFHVAESSCQTHCVSKRSRWTRVSGVACFPIFSVDTWCTSQTCCTLGGEGCSLHPMVWTKLVVH